MFPMPTIKLNDVLTLTFKSIVSGWKAKNATSNYALAPKVCVLLINTALKKSCKISKNAKKSDKIQEVYVCAIKLKCYPLAQPKPAKKQAHFVLPLKTN